MDKNEGQAWQLHLLPKFAKFSKAAAPGALRAMHQPQPLGQRDMARLAARSASSTGGKLHI